MFSQLRSAAARTITSTSKDAEFCPLDTINFFALRSILYHSSVRTRKAAVIPGTTWFASLEFVLKEAAQW
jgi:hypothetical protein